MLAIAPGDKVAIDGQVFEFTHLTAAHAFCFREPENGNVKQLEEDEILQKFYHGQILLRVQANEKDGALLAIPDYSCASEEHKKLVDDRLAYIKAIYHENQPRPMAKKWPAIIRNVAASLRHAQPPEWTTVRRWMRKYEDNKGDIRSLFPSYSRRGRKPSYRSPEEQEFLNEQLKKYLQGTRPSIKWLHGQIETAYRDARRTRIGASMWRIPSLSTVHRWLKRIEPYERSRLRYGKRIADEQFRGVGPGRPARYRLDVVEIDHTSGNIMIIDDERQYCLGRPTITVAIDRFTRMIVGLYIGFEPPSTYSVMQCLRDMLLPHDYMATEFPQIRLPWKAFGPPTTVVVDNAIEFRNESFRHVAGIIKFDIYQQPVNQPQFKGIVERFMRTIEQRLMTGLPGRTFSNPKEKADYDPAKHACVTLKEFRLLFYSWMLAEYCNRTHEGILDVPARRWDEEVNRQRVRIAYNRDDLDSLLGMSVTKVLTRKGLRFASLFYRSPELDAYFASAETKEERTVTFTVNPGEISAISALIPGMRYPIKAYCTYPEYATGLTLHQHRLIRALRIKQNKEYESEASLVAARDEFRRLQAALLARTGTTHRRRHARALGQDMVEQRESQANIDIVKKLLISDEVDTDIVNLLESDTAPDAAAGEDGVTEDALPQAASNSPARASRTGRAHREWNDEEEEALEPLPIRSRTGSDPRGFAPEPEEH